MGAVRLRTAQTSQGAVNILYQICLVQIADRTESLVALIKTLLYSLKHFANTSFFLPVLIGYLQSSGHYMYRTAVTICTAQPSLYVPHSGHYMYRTSVIIRTAQ